MLQCPCGTGGEWGDKMSMQHLPEGPAPEPALSDPNGTGRRRGRWTLSPRFWRPPSGRSHSARWRPAGCIFRVSVRPPSAPAIETIAPASAHFSAGRGGRIDRAITTLAMNDQDRSRVRTAVDSGKARLGWVTVSDALREDGDWVAVSGAGFARTSGFQIGRCWSPCPTRRARRSPSPAWWTEGEAESPCRFISAVGSSTSSRCNGARASRSRQNDDGRRLGAAFHAAHLVGIADASINLAVFLVACGAIVTTGLIIYKGLYRVATFRGGSWTCLIV